MKPSQALTPLALLVIGGLLLFGCIPLPGSYKNAAGDRRPEQKIGEPGSDRPIILGESDRERVYAVLGQPTLADEVWQVVAFRYDVVTSYVWIPVCAVTNRNTSPRYLGVRFDGDGVLRASKVFADRDELVRWAGRKLEPTLRPAPPPPDRDRPPVVTTRPGGAQ